MMDQEIIKTSLQISAHGFETQYNRNVESQFLTSFIERGD